MRAVHAGRLAGVRADRRFDISTPAGKVTAISRNYRLLQRGDGYAYAWGAEESRVIHRNFYAGARAPKLRISLTGHWASMPDAEE